MHRRGTALLLADSIEKGRAVAKRDLRLGRSGMKRSTETGELGIMAIRGGDVIGEHTAFFFLAPASGWS